MYQGPVIAGKMGMSITVTNALGTVALAWMNTKASPFGTLVAKRQFDQLDRIFFRTMKQSIVFLVVACSAVFAGLLLSTHWAPGLAGRVLTPWAFALLLATSATNHIVFCEALYLRAHKAEPFLVSGVIFSILMGTGTYLLGRYGSVNSIAIWYFVAIGIISPIVATTIFTSKRKQWHLLTSGYCQARLKDVDGQE
jgi:multisubunit Na+/H+ antiporter MnhG subunit